MKKRLIVLILVVVVAVVVVAVVAFWPGAPAIPANHEGRTTCFGCHETGSGGAPILPQSHIDKIQDGKLTDNVTDCLECHEFEEAA